MYIGRTSPTVGTSFTQGRGDMAADDESASPGMISLMVNLRLNGSEPPSGTIVALDGAVAQPFYGWIDLMSVINKLRGWDGTEEIRDQLP